jgi:integrase
MLLRLVCTYTHPGLRNSANQCQTGGQILALTCGNTASSQVSVSGYASSILVARSSVTCANVPRASDLHTAYTWGVPKPVPYTSKDGTVTWRVRLRHNGRETSETFPTLRAAEIFCRDIADHGVDRAMRMRDEDGREQRGGRTLDDVLEEYLVWKAPRVRSDRTIADYRKRYNLAIRPRFGSTPVGNITEADVRQWLDDIVAGTLAARTVVVGGQRTKRALHPKTIADRHALLHALVKHAQQRGWITLDPCAHSELPKRHKGAPKGLRPAEWQALHAALATIDPDAADLALFLVSSGWRWGEATALSTYDVEEYDGRMLVSVTQVMRRDATGRAKLVADAKSDTGLRRIGLDPDCADMVRRRAARATPGGLVFTTRTGAPWHHSHFRSRVWEPAVTAANLSRRPTIHWLRHTHVAWMAMTGAAGLPELQARLGHKSIQTTIGVYGRLIADVRPEALGAFAAMRGSNPTVGRVNDAGPIALSPRAE